jgi:hypothetical protein
MNKLARNLAAALLFFWMTAVTLADGQMGLPLSGPSTQCLTCVNSQDQTDTTLQGQTDAPPATSPTSGEITGRPSLPLTDAGLILFESFSSIL